MKIITLLLVLCSGSVGAVDLIVGGFSHHIGPQTYKDHGKSVTYNSKHNMKGLGLEYGDYYLSAINYTNSFYTESNAVSIQYKYKNVYIGVTVASGYDQWNLSNIGKLSASPSMTDANT